MRALVCELCGSNDFIKKDGVFVCQHCGTKYSVEEARKIIGTVTIDKSKEVENLYRLARRAKDNENEKDAAKYYDKILLYEPDSWEASFYHTFFNAWQCQVEDISSVAEDVAAAAKVSLSFIEMIEDEEERDSSAEEIALQVKRIAELFNQAAITLYKEKYGTKDLINRLKSIYIMCRKTADILYESETLLGNKALTARTEIYKAVIENIYYHYTLLAAVGSRSVIEEALKRIHEVDSSYKLPQNAKNPGCYIATCVYGAYDCPEVWTLRRYRDNSLACTWYGRAFIRAYYKTSPAIVKRFGNRNWFKGIWLVALNRKIEELNQIGVSNLPYEDKHW